MALAYASEDLRGDAEVLAAAAGNTQRQVEVTPSFFWTRESCRKRCHGVKCVPGIYVFGIVSRL